MTHDWPDNTDDDNKRLIAERDRLRAVLDAARAYRAAEQDDTPRMWKGKKLCDLADALDVAIAKATGGAP